MTIALARTPTVNPSLCASVLLQIASRMPSDEARSHLYDAHDRMMSVAAVQQQLAATRLGEVGVRAYFIDLCRSISASMIPDRQRLSLDVEVDESVADSNISVSLGLIVTELVINALKHAFPRRRPGKIIVGYHSDGPEWKLSVSDNEVGMPADPESIKAGLGTGIVQALARQLTARVEVAGESGNDRVDHPLWSGHGARRLGIQRLRGPRG